MLVIGSTLVPQGRRVVVKVFVRSRWQAVSPGRGYFWQPEEPAIVRTFEQHSEFLSDYSRTLLGWAQYAGGLETRYHLYLSGLRAGYADEMHRPINHTVVWTDLVEKEARKLLHSYVHNPAEFAHRISTLIGPDVDCGFRVANSDLAQLGSEKQHSFSPIPHRPKRRLKPQEVSDKEAALLYLENTLLRSLGRSYGVNAEQVQGLVVAMGKGFSLRRFGKAQYPYLLFVYDTSKQDTETL